MLYHIQKHTLNRNIIHKILIPRRLDVTISYTAIVGAVVLLYIYY